MGSGSSSENAKSTEKDVANLIKAVEKQEDVKQESTKKAVATVNDKGKNAKTSNSYLRKPLQKNPERNEKSKSKNKSIEVKSVRQKSL